jgi:anti-anti-sigma factor
MKMEGEVKPFFIKRRGSDGRVVLELGGECDASTLDELNEALHGVVEQLPREVVVDLAQTTFIDSLTLGSLTAAAKEVRARVGASSALSGRGRQRSGARSKLPAWTSTSWPE